ncbi:Imm51 family immunity protein [Streptomyces parvulus]|uniref:Imm51 family immunity protein n=1 Tax=Streptomyces parvulus TaxID=146923 RepID=UPI0033F43521
MTITLHDLDGEHSLTLDAGALAADAAVVAAGHEPNGYFWEGLVQFAWPDLAERLDFDSEGGMFCALGSLSDLRGRISTDLGTCGSNGVPARVIFRPYAHEGRASW